MNFSLNNQSRMTLGHPPWITIEEAMYHAERLCYLVPGMNTARIPY